MTDKQKDLCLYRIAQAKETIQSAELCLDNHFFKDTINRSYYASFYAVKAVLATDGVDFKRHKDVVAYFNQNYVAKETVTKTMGRMLSRLQKKRESSDYDDFYSASFDEAREQLESAKQIVNEIEKYIDKLNIR